MDDAHYPTLRASVLASALIGAILTLPISAALASPTIRIDGLTIAGIARLVY